MSGIKRNFLAEDCSATTNDNNSSLTDNNIQSSSPSDSPQSKKLRRSSSHHTTESENDDETQEDQYEQENGVTNGHSPVQSERSEEEEDDDEDDDDDDDDDEATEAEPECFSDDSIVHVSFDNGKDDIFRYDGSIRFHIIAPSRPQSGQLTSDQSIIRTFIWTLLAFSKPNYDSCHNDGGTFSLFLKCEPEKLSPGWSIFAKAELTLLHATDPNKNFVKKINHLFNARSIDWGFHQFKSLKEIYSEFIHWPDNTIRIEAKIHADAPRNVEWDSKGQTGFVGLRNIGATCYMNSILQCLLNIDPFRYDLMVTNSELITSSLLEENTIYLCVLKILALLQDRQSTQSQHSTTTQLTDDERTVESQALINLKKAVEKHSGNFLGSRQQDSHEFLNLVISLITDEIDAIKIQINEQSLLFKHIIVDPTTNNFQFCLSTKRCCEICGMSTITTEIHTALLIHVTDEESKTAKNNSLTDLLENYFASESMDGCYCDNCQSNQRKYIKYNLERLPRIFIFYLKRWHITKNSNGELQSVSKEDHPIDCSIEVNVYPFCSSNTYQPPMINYLEELPNLKDLLKQREQTLNIIEPKRAKIEQNDSEKIEINREENIIATHAKYRLFAVINHHGGSSDVGHYTSTVYDAKGDTWWTYDDTSVTSCTEQRVLQDLAPDAYGVMYMHKDIVKLFQPVINNSMQ